jgi:hypothetical protein
VQGIKACLGKSSTNLWWWDIPYCCYKLLFFFLYSTNILYFKDTLTMLYRTLFASMLVFASTIMFSAQANAETSDVNFDGTIAPKCTFSNIIPGTLSAGSPQFMSGNNAQGSVTIFCNTPATVSVADPVDNGTTGSTSFNWLPALIYNPVTNNVAGSPSYGGGTLNIASGSLTGLVVNMGLQTTDPAFKAGDYKFNVKVTSTP